MIPKLELTAGAEYAVTYRLPGQRREQLLRGGFLGGEADGLKFDCRAGGPGRSLGIRCVSFRHITDVHPVESDPARRTA